MGSRSVAGQYCRSSTFSWAALLTLWQAVICSAFLWGEIIQGVGQEPRQCRRTELQVPEVVVSNAHTMTGVHSAPDIKPECVRLAP